MDSQLLDISTTEAAMPNNEKLNDASALLALMHGKNDSICRVFSKEIFVTREKLIQLNKMVIDKLSLHTVGDILTSIDVTMSDKEVLSFKSWPEFELKDFSFEHAATKSIFVQWDFMIKLERYKIPQRHTVSIRISTTPNPSDFFKVLLSGGFDEEHDIELQTSTMLCKVDFINNTLAEELINVAAKWNDLCENAYSKKGILRLFLARFKNECANIGKISTALTIAMIIAFAARWYIAKRSIVVDDEVLLYAIIFSIPLYVFINKISHNFGQMIFNKFGELMDTHIFGLSNGDKKELERIDHKSKCGKEVALFVINTLTSIILSIIFLFV